MLWVRLLVSWTERWIYEHETKIAFSSDLLKQKGRRARSVDYYVVGKYVDNSDEVSHASYKN